MRFKYGGRVQVFYDDVEITGEVVNVHVDQHSDWIPVFDVPGPTRVPLPTDGIITIIARQTNEQDWVPTLEPSHILLDPQTNEQENNVSKNVSTKEQVEVRTTMAGIIREAVEQRYGKARIWAETEVVGPLGGVSAQVYGAVEYDGKVVSFAINVYSDDRIQEKLEKQVELEAENDRLRNLLGW
jgi:hypothetical protein